MHEHMIGCKVLVTCSDWFYAPDGRQYKAAWGTVKAVYDAEKVLGIRTNARSTNWYLEVGCMIIAGCQIHYIASCETCNFGRAEEWANDGEKGMREYDRPSVIFNADAERLLL